MQNVESISMALAKLSRFLRKHPVREMLRNARDPEEIMKIIKENEE